MIRPTPIHAAPPVRTAIALALASAATVLLAGALSPVGGAAAAPPASGDLVTLTLTSDVHRNDSLVWFDAHGALRHQSDVPLSTPQPATGRWTASLTYTRDHDTPAPPLTAMFVSGGRYAACEVTVAGKTTSENSSTGEDAIAVCE